MPPVSMELPSSALSTAGKSRALRILAAMLWTGCIGFALALAYTPWQQSVQGSGRVIAYAPLERQQAVEAPIDGRVVQWFVQEGDQVDAGQPIAELSDNDPMILERLAREAEATEAQVQAAELSITLTESKIASERAAMASDIAAAEQKVRVGQEKREGALRAVDAAKAGLITAELNRDRVERLFQKGLASQREHELALLKYEQSATGLDRAKASLRAVEQEIESLKATRDKIRSYNLASIDSTRSSLEKLKADRAKAQGELVKVETRLARQRQMRIVAPRAGTILRLVAKQGTEMVKAGDDLVLLVPEVGSRAIELYVDGNDAPLVQKDRHVRIQFEGWPAVQFVGWPSVAVGTFGGKVAFVDAHDDGTGKFRIVIVPENETDWPERRYLRQGVRAKAWVLLNQVPLGFELWRQLNGFPPALRDENAAKTGGGKGGDKK